MQAEEFIKNIQKREAEFARRRDRPQYPSNDNNQPLSDSIIHSLKIVFTPHSAYVWFKKIKKKH